MNCYNLKVDIYNYFYVNKRNFLVCSLFVFAGMLLGCIFAFGIEIDTLENSKDVYFCFLRGEGKSIGFTIFFSIIFYFTLLTLSKICIFTRKIAIVLILYRAYEFFNRLVLIGICFGVGCIFGIILTTIIELAVCFLFIILYFINNNVKYYNCKEFFSFEYIVCLGGLIVCLMFLGLLLCFSYNLIANFT